jgi:glycosyltransferase involved in cell wall biosynthesis
MTSTPDEPNRMSQDVPPRISVVLPVFEEADGVGGLIDDLTSLLEARGEPFEIVAVDDGSSDGTLESLKAAVARHGQVRVVRHLVNRGNGASLRTGIRAARGDIVVTMDADGQHRAEHLPEMLKLMPPYDLVIGARTAGYRGPAARAWANSFYNAFSSWLVSRRIDDLTSGLRAMRRSAVLHFLPLFPDGFSAPTTTTLAFLKAGYNVAFVPINVQPRQSGVSKIRPFQDGARFVRVILRMVMLYDPLRIFLPTGVVLAALGLLAWAAGLWAAGRLVLPNSAILLFSSALMTWLLGLVSDQIASTKIHYHGDESLVFVEVPERPDEDETPPSAR